MVEELNNSILAKIGSAIAWIFAPLGWTKAGEGWKMAVAAVTGLIAKENVVATFGMLFGFAEVAEDGAEIWGNLAQVMTPIAAYGFLVFNLLCAPCFAACKQCTNLINAKGNYISKTTLITDCKPEPFCVVHLSLDCTHSREARSAKKIEYQESVSCNRLSVWSCLCSFTLH